MNNVGPDDLIELLEPLTDKAYKDMFYQLTGEALPTLLDSVPLAKVFTVSGKIISTAINRNRARKLLALFDSFGKTDGGYEKFKALPEKDKRHLRELVFYQLETQSDELHARASAYLLSAYLDKKLNWADFNALFFELEKTNPAIFYFTEYTLERHEDRQDPIIDIVGPTQYLTAPMGGLRFIDYGTFSSTGEQRYSLSLLGQKFFYHVYIPLYKESLNKG